MLFGLPELVMHNSDRRESLERFFCMRNENEGELCTLIARTACTARRPGPCRNRPRRRSIKCKHFWVWKLVMHVRELIARL